MLQLHKKQHHSSLGDQAEVCKYDAQELQLQFQVQDVSLSCLLKVQTCLGDCVATNFKGLYCLSANCCDNGNETQGLLDGSICIRHCTQGSSIEFFAKLLCHLYRIYKAAAAWLVAYQYECPCEHDYTDSTRHKLYAQALKRCTSCNGACTHMCKSTSRSLHAQMAGAAQGSADSYVRLYLALLLAQFFKHLWLLLQVSQQQRECRGTGVVSSKQQIEGNILHREQDLLPALPYVYGKQVCLQPIFTLTSGLCLKVTCRSTHARWTCHQGKQIYWG